MVETLGKPASPPHINALRNQRHTMKSNTLKLAIAALIGLAIIGGDMLVSL
jgi:hypothetical protein